ncbi:MAG: isopentenyl-diphosphate Delta-isomerase [Bacteroidetes bacterium]|nr:MAG: isopentenyl-diphosphate delta-isomerase [Bacteroidetes bacterium OLB10]MBX3105070.1 isopentenyl-diphosphate Delta-isomerase [Bacteroidota bacterium]MCB8929948.1 isopentenyl-diphosphate Delta-isomerase [Bacteroidia bacterium]MCE7954363.1 isopentenyl-diphosphate Delta-isomerase [Bacteroidetes bacterium CHB6]MCB0849004.1 isopentenyl-diphosphate Delta-isomerase [Bacteroidota bacterium]
MVEYVTLVNQNDEVIGEMEKMQAHELGLLHRAFSVFVFNSKNELLLQKRSSVKYHSSGLWTNTCCGHPRPDEEVKAAAKRRLKEEMGIFCELNFKQTFLYKAKFGNGLTEHEVDHIFIAVYDGNVTPDPAEAEAYKWQPISQIKSEIKTNPEGFTFWFKEIINLF